MGFPGSVALAAIGAGPKSDNTVKK